MLFKVEDDQVFVKHTDYGQLSEHGWHEVEHMDLLPGQIDPATGFWRGQIVGRDGTRWIGDMSLEFWGQALFSTPWARNPRG